VKVLGELKLPAPVVAESENEQPCWGLRMLVNGMPHGSDSMSSVWWL